MLFLFHYNEEKKIEELLNIMFATKNRKLNLQPKLEAIFEYGNKLKACSDIILCL